MTRSKLLSVGTLCICCAICLYSGRAQTAHQLRDVKRIYVGSLGNKAGADQLRKDLLNELRRSKFTQLAPSPASADAAVTGTGEMWIKGYYSLNPRAGVVPRNGTPVYGGSLSIELVGKDKETLWSYLVTPRVSSTNVARDLCRELVRQLDAAIERDQASKQPPPRS